VPKLCPFKPPKSEACAEGPECYRERCACWDEGVYYRYWSGCGLVPRENRRV